MSLSVFIQKTAENMVLCHNTTEDICNFWPNHLEVSVLSYLEFSLFNINLSLCENKRQEINLFFQVQVQILKKHIKF